MTGQERRRLPLILKLSNSRPVVCVSGRDGAQRLCAPLKLMGGDGGMIVLPVRKSGELNRRAALPLLEVEGRRQSPAPVQVLPVICRGTGFRTATGCWKPARYTD